MPVWENHITIQIARGLMAFLDLRAGVARGVAPESGGARQPRGPITGGEGIKARNIVWIFGAGRSGTTWLRDMLCSVEGYSPWEEPLVGRLFGGFYQGDKHRSKAGNFIFADRHRAVWLDAVRKMVLDGANVRFPERLRGGHVVVKEPNGSVGAPLLSEALPESSVITLVRDPRDVCASSLDGKRQGGWQHSRRRDADWSKRNLADKNPEKFIRTLAGNCARNMGGAVAAYHAHKGPKTLVRYEDLNKDALGAMRRIHRELDLPVEETELARSVERHSWENIPKRKRGEGKFYRKAAPGSWREDLTPRQVEIVERATAPLIEEFYSSHDGVGW